MPMQCVHHVCVRAALVCLVFLPPQDGRLLNCRSLSASDATISCTTSSGVNYTVSVTVVDGECQWSSDMSNLWGG